MSSANGRRTAAGLPVEVAERIGPFYVYLLVDPRDGRPFYVGKGTGDRVAAHGRQAALETEKGQTRKALRIRDIRAAGREPGIEIVRHGLSEAEAYLVEGALIDSLPGLTNAVLGHGAGIRRTTVDDLIARYGAEPLGTGGPAALLIRLTPRWLPGHEELEGGYYRDGAGWHAGITPVELADATRGWWKISSAAAARRQARYVVAVAGGITRAAYRIGTWVGPRADGRRAFTITPLEPDDEGYRHYVGEFGKRVPFTEHSQNALLYWPRP